MAQKPGEPVSRDEVICDIETDKVVLKLLLLLTVQLVAIIKGEGDTVLSDEVIAQFEEGAVSAAANPPVAASSKASCCSKTAGLLQLNRSTTVQNQAPAVRKALSETGIHRC